MDCENISVFERFGNLETLVPAIVEDLKNESELEVVANLFLNILFYPPSEEISYVFEHNEFENEWDTHHEPLPKMGREIISSSLKAFKRNGLFSYIFDLEPRLVDLIRPTSRGNIEILYTPFSEYSKYKKSIFQISNVRDYKFRVKPDLSSVGYELFKSIQLLVRELKMN